MAKQVLVYGAEWCADCKMAKDYFALQKIAYEYHDIDTEPGAREAMLQLSDGKNIIPTISVDGIIYQEPSTAELNKIFEEPLHMDKQANTHDVIMIGAGPTSLAAAVYTTREDIDTLLFEKGVIGGLAAITDWVDNYPGFPEGLAGLDLAENLRQQAERFGTKFELGEVTAIEKSGSSIKLATTSGDYFAKSVLIATGSDYKKLGIPGEDAYYGRGVHFCATCDGAFYRDKHIVVVGGGNSAVQEALFLTKFASKIDLLVRGDAMRASDVLQHELAKNDKITVHLNTTTDEIVGNEKNVEKVIGTDTKTGKQIDFKTDGVFVFIGLKPNTGFLTGSSIELDDVGLVKTNEKLETAVPGIFAAGDVRSGATMQIASAVGEGATAALRIREYIEEHERANN
jgi:thioredoxin reductase (NADPH)